MRIRVQSDWLFNRVTRSSLLFIGIDVDRVSSADEEIDIVTTRCKHENDAIDQRGSEIHVQFSVH